MKHDQVLTMEKPALLQLPPEDHRDAVDALLESLTGLHARLSRLGDLADLKLAALRDADALRLNDLASDEAAELEALAADDAAREAALARVAHGLPGAVNSPRRLTEIAESFSEPLRSKILGKSEGLRAMANRLAEKNRLVADVARGLHNHVRGIFAEVAKVNQEAVVYGKDGREHQRTSKSWVDAVG